VSEENVALVRKATEYYVATGEALWAALDEDLVVYDHDILDAGDYRGHEGYTRWFEDFAAPWSSFTISPQEFLAAGDRVIAIFKVNAVGAASGITVERQDAMVCEVRDLKVVRIDYYNNRQEALKAVGLEE
jgi:ketosteroid isomerase-like protein